MTHFTCAQCGRRFKWTEALAGKRAKCLCGATVACPIDPIDETHDPYELADAPTVEATRLAPTVASAPVIDSPAATTRTLQYQSAPTAPRLTDEETLKNFHIPLGLLAGGVTIEVIAAFIQHRRGIDRALTAIGMQLIFGTAIMLAGVFITAKVRGIKLGSFWNACFKLSAVAVAPGAAGTLVGSMLRIIPLSGLLVWLGEFALYFALLGLLFDLDESDTWYCVCVIFVLNVGVYFALLYAEFRL